MKRPHSILLFLILLSLGYSSWSQLARVETGPKKKWVKEISFDKQATPPSGQETSYYYLLIDEQDNFTTQEDFTHYAYKILSNDGVQQMSDLSFDFDPSYEKLIVHSLVIHRGNETINKLPKDIRVIQREESMDRYLYDGSMTAIINISDVRVGDIIEYAMTRRGHNPIYAGTFNRRIYLNYGFAFEKSCQRIIVEDSSKITLKYINTTAERKPVIEAEGKNISYTWLTNQASAVLSDKHEPSWYNPYQQILVSTFKNWGEVAKWASKNFIVNETESRALLNELANKFQSTTPEGYALEATRFVQDEIRYLGFESGLNSQKPHSPLKVFNQRFGDCKDKSLLLVTLLRANGIEAYPFLANTDYAEKIAEQLPSANAFDHCVVQLKLNNKIIYIDPTISNQGGTIDNTFFPAYGKGLVVSDTTTDLTDIGKPTEASISEIQTFDMDTIGGGSLLTVKTIFKGSEADNQRAYFSRNNLETIQKNYLNFYSNLYADIVKAENIITTDSRDSNIFVVEEHYKISKIWKQDNADVISCEFYPQSLESYFNISKSHQRATPYRLSYPLNYTHEIHVNALENWNITTDVDDIESEFYNYHYEVGYKNNELFITTNYQTKASSIPATAYETFVQDHEKMLANLNYKITYDSTPLKAKSNKWAGIMVSLVAIGMGVCLVLWLYHRYDPRPHYPAVWGQEIGGWLILVAIGLCITPLAVLLDFVNNTALVSGEAWLTMWYTKSYALFAFLLLEHIYNIVYLLFSVLLLTLFFKRRSSVPTLITILYSVTCLVTIIDNIVAIQIDPSIGIDRIEIARSILAAAIWIPYFKMSNRVKKTFVNLRDNNGEDLVPEPVVAEH